jgi:hypothetical protein
LVGARGQGVKGDDNLTVLASGFLAGAVLTALGAGATIWWYRQAAMGWSPPSPRVWELLTLAGTVLASVALVLCVVAAVRRPTAGGKAVALAWALVAVGVLVALPALVRRWTPEGRHAVVVAVDAATGDVRWRVETGGWSVRTPAISGDRVTVLTIGGDSEPCEAVTRRLTLGLDGGAMLALERRSATQAQRPPSDFVIRGSYLVHASGNDVRWRLDLAPLGLSGAHAIVAGEGVVVVAGDGQVPLQCRK